VAKLTERDDGLVVSDDKSLLDLERIVAWLAVSYWANERDRATIERSLEHSYVVGVYTPTGEQVALARATTDFASFAWMRPGAAGAGVGFIAGGDLGLHEGAQEVLL
jgi:hypothetical protein